MKDDELKESKEFLNDVQDRKGKIYVNGNDDHIKILQMESNGMIYIRSAWGEEMLVPNNVFCQLLRKFCDLNNWGRK
jgi:hypothetical protein